MEFDVLIAGGGPAGMTCAIYCARAGLKCVIIEKMFAGGQMAITSEVGNYPGLGEVSGADIAMKMQEQTEKFGVNIVYDEITGFDLENKKIKTSSGEYRGKAIILCMGAVPRKLGIERETRFEGRGVSYCATCDGAFYKGKDVCVVGGGNTALEDAEYLSNIAKNIYLIHRRNEFRGQKILQERIRQIGNINIMTPYVPLEIDGDNKVEFLSVKNIETDEITKIKCDGIFAAVGTQPATGLLKGKIEMDESGYIIAGETTKTGVPGVFAAGDIRTKALRQIATAVGDGANAGFFASEYCNRL